METGLLLSVFSSWEMIAVCVVLMLFLPVVFYVASTKSRRKPVPATARKGHGGARHAAPRPAAPAQAASPAADGPDEEPRRRAGTQERE